MAGLPKRIFHLFILAAIFVLLATLSLSSQGYYGGADNITHYLIAHYSFRYPYLFLNAWGRPLYTILAAPFAQFGLQGVKLLNILLGLSTAWLAFRIAGELKIKTAFMALIFVCFTPLYFLMMPTALTEILFSFVFMLSVYLFIRKRFIASAIVISFLPFARTEGFVLLPLFFLALLWARQYKSVFFLSAGVVFFSILGCFHYRDVFWVFTQFPYPVTYHHPIYNKTGSLWHFLESRDYSLGLPLEILFITGVFAIARDFFSRDKKIRMQGHFLFILVLTPFLLYVAFHSVLFWKAMGGSMGLGRVLAAVMPLAALVALKGYSALKELASQNIYIRGVFMMLVISIVVIIPFIGNVLPYPLSPEEKTIKEASAWLRTSPYAGRLLFYTDNNVPYYLGVDPYRKDPASCYLFGDSKYLDTIPAGSVLVWDAHFGANESKIPLDSLLNNQRLQVVRYFRPARPWITFGGYDYDCYIAMVNGHGTVADNYAIRDSLREELESGEIKKTIYFNTFENPGDGWNLSWDILHRGKAAYLMDGRSEYSPGACLKISDAGISPEDSTMHGNRQTAIRAIAWVYLPGPVNPANTLMVISFENKGKPYSYTSFSLNEQKMKLNRWNRISLTVPIPAFKSPDDLLKVYVWNPGKQVFYMDDVRVDLISY